MKPPEPNRARLSGYVDAGKLLPFSWVDVRMDSARNYWITTNGHSFPHSRPVWGIWQSPLLYFSTGSLIARHIAADSRVQVNLESGDEAVIIEGVAGPMPATHIDQWVAAYRAKYNWDMPRSAEDVYVVEPKRVLAWICDSSGRDGGVLFSNTATEWRFATG